MASFSALMRGGQAKAVNLRVSKPKARGAQSKPPSAIGYGGTTGKYEHTLGEAGPGRVADTKTIAERGGGVGGPPSYTNPPGPDTKTAAERGGGLGGPSTYTPPTQDTQSVSSRGGGLGGARMKRRR